MHCSQAKSDKETLMESRTAENDPRLASDAADVVLLPSCSRGQPKPPTVRGPVIVKRMPPLLTNIMLGL